MHTVPKPLRDLPVGDATALPVVAGALAVEPTAGGDSTVLALQGALDLAVAGPLRVALGTAVEASRSTGHRVVVDLEAVTFLDSTALGAFLTTFRRLRRGGGALRLAHAGKQPLLALRLTNLLAVLGGEAPTADAAAALAGVARG